MSSAQQIVCEFGQSFAAVTFTFPNDFNTPSESDKGTALAQIASAVVGNLRVPVG